MKRRASSSQLYERPHKIPHLVLRLSVNTDTTRKRLRDYSDLELAQLFKRLNPAPENRIEIGLVVKEIKSPKKKTRIYLHPCLWEYYAWGMDPRNWYASDIQRAFRGWLFRKRLKSGRLNNSFI